jgi:Putative addiction module component
MEKTESVKIPVLTEMSPEQLFSLISQIPHDLKLLLFQKLQSELLAEAETLPEWHRDILQDRIQEYQSKQAKTVNWAEFEKQMQAKYAI